jgi:hypothetical protein
MQISTVNRPSISLKGLLLSPPAPTPVARRRCCVMATVLQNRGLARIDNDQERGWSVAITDDGDRVLREDPSGTL